VSENKKTSAILTAIILASLAASLSYSFYFKIRPAVDAAAYDRIAWNLVQGNGYKENSSLSYDEDIAILRVGPGYQFFLAGIYFVFGRSYEVAWVINALLHALTALLAYFLSKEIFRENWNRVLGFASAAFTGFSPDLITMSGMLMTETLAVFLVILLVYLFFKHINSPDRLTYLIPMALVFGFAVLTRTPSALLVLPIFYYFFTCPEHGRGGKKQWVRFFIFIAVLTAVFTPWTVRNYKIYNAFIPTTGVLGYDLLVGNHPGASGELEPYEPAERYVYEYGRTEGNKLALKEVLSFIFFNPLEFLKITLKRISIYFSISRPTGFWFHLEGADRAVTLVFSAIYSALIFGLGFWGVYKIKFLSNPDKEGAKLLFWLTLMAPLAVIFIIVETRYRFLIYPLLAVFAGFGLSDLFKKKLEFRPALAIWGVLLLNGAIDGLRNLDRVAEKLKELL